MHHVFQLYPLYFWLLLLHNSSLFSRMLHCPFVAVEQQMVPTIFETGGIWLLITIQDYDNVASVNMAPVRRLGK